MLTKKKRRIIFWFSILAFCVILIPVLLYSLGYRLDANWKIQKTGGIFIEASQTGAFIYIDGKENKKTSILSGNALIKNLTPSRHLVVIKKDGFWDWKKTLEIFPETVSSKTALLIPKDLSAEIVSHSTSTDASPYLKKNAIFKENKLIFSSVKKFWILPGTADLLILGEDGDRKSVV